MNQDLPSSPETPAPFWSFENNPDVLHIDRDEFPGTRPGLRAIREMAETAAINAPLAEMAVAEFVMAIDELSANIVEHGYEKQETTTGQEGESPLIIEIGRFPDRLEALITDHVAIRFLVADAPRLGLASFLQDTRTRGLGLDIVRHCVDDVEQHWLHPPGNQTRLVKFYRSTES